MGRFIIKHINNFTPQKPASVISNDVKISNEKNDVKNIFIKDNNVEKNKTVMTTEEKIAMAQEVLNNKKTTPSFKRVKKDKGLIERTESSKTILTEDNKELLND